MKNKIYANDLSIINALFFSENKAFVIYDPAENIKINKAEKCNVFKELDDLIGFCNNASTDFVFINVSNQRPFDYVNHAKIIGCIDFYKKNVKDSISYFFVNNPDQSMRWIFPKKKYKCVFSKFIQWFRIKSFCF